MLLRGILAAALLIQACHKQAVVGASGGTASNGIVSLVFPPGALPADTHIGIAPRTGDADAIPGTAWDFSPDGAHFDQPVTVTVRWDPSALGGADPSTLAMVHVHSDGSR